MTEKTRLPWENAYLENLYTAALASELTAEERQIVLQAKNALEQGEDSERNLHQLSANLLQLATQKLSLTPIAKALRDKCEASFDGVVPQIMIGYAGNAIRYLKPAKQLLQIWQSTEESL